MEKRRTERLVVVGNGMVSHRFLELLAARAAKAPHPPQPSFEVTIVGEEPSRFSGAANPVHLAARADPGARNGRPRHRLPPPASPFRAPCPLSACFSQHKYAVNKSASAKFTERQCDVNRGAGRPAQTGPGPVTS